MTATGARRAALTVLAALALLLPACSAGPSAPAPGAAAPDSSGVSAGPLTFSGATVDGGRFDAATLAGTPTVLWFWAPL